MRFNIGAQPSLALWDCRFPHCSFSLNTWTLCNENKWRVDGTVIIDFSISIKTIFSENQLTFVVDNTIINLAYNTNVLLWSVCIFPTSYSFISFSTLQILLMNKTDLFQEKILQSGRHLRFYLSCYKGRIDLSVYFEFLNFNFVKYLVPFLVFFFKADWVFICVFSPFVLKGAHSCQFMSLLSYTHRDPPGHVHV